MRLGHISDLHISERKRYPRNGFTARECDRYAVRLAKGLLGALREAQVEHLVVTGDLTFSGEPSEFERAADLLAPWAAADKLTVVPGNHDVWTYEAVARSRFQRSIGPNGKGMKKPAEVYPYLVELSPEVVLIALDSARQGENPYETPGCLGPGQIQATRELVRQQSKEGKAVLLALHHHLVLPPDRVASDACVARMPLADADQIIRLVAELPISAVLHGHRHTAFRLDLPGVARVSPVLCAGSATRVSDEPVKRARAYLYEVDTGGIRGVEALVASIE